MPLVDPRFAFAMIALFLSAAAPQPAHAQRPAPISQSHEINQVKLTEDMVNRFLGTMDGVKSLTEKYHDQMPRSRSSRDPVAGFTGFLQAHRARGEMQTVLKSHGFTNIANWLDVARTIMITYGYVKSGKSPRQANHQMEQAIAQIQNNPKLTPQQRDMIIKSFGSSMAQFRRLQPTPENFALIKRMRHMVAAKVERFSK